jgi:hypothetical protein
MDGLIKKQALMIATDCKPAATLTQVTRAPVVCHLSSNSWSVQVAFTIASKVSRRVILNRGTDTQKKEITMTDNKPLRITIVLSATLVALALLITAVLPYAAANLGWTTGYGYGSMQAMMAQGMGPGMMQGSFNGFGLPFMNFGMFLWPLLFIGAAVVGIVWLMRGQPTTRCIHCGGAVQPGWKACPQCGEKI